MYPKILSKTHQENLNEFKNPSRNSSHFKHQLGKVFPNTYTIKILFLRLDLTHSFSFETYERFEDEVGDLGKEATTT